MAEFKQIRILNKSLNSKEWESAINQVGKFCIILYNDSSIYCGSFSTIKKEYSIDYGCITTQYNRVVLAIKHYLGNLLKGVELI